MKNAVRFFLFLFLLGVFMISFASAEWVDCWQYNSFNGGTKASCNSVGCLWASDTLADVAADLTDIYDPHCTDFDNCCFPNQCWQFDGNETACNDGISAFPTAVVLNCTWDPYMTIWAPNGSIMANGGCMSDWSDMDENWGGTQDGCWQYDGNKAQCTTGDNAQKCSWSVNDANQNPWCGIKNLDDAKSKNSGAVTTDIGCCQQKGCWSYDGTNQTVCENNPSFEYLCTWKNKTTDSYCPDDVGCCYTKWCGEVGDNETLCNSLRQDLMMPCEFNLSGTGLCEEKSGGGFSFFNDTDSCMQQGGWYDISGECVMPDMTNKGGSLMFGGEAHCWFADDQPNVCGNISGCVYCVSGNGINGTENYSSNNICARKQIGVCEGHNSWDSNNYLFADNSVNLNCSHIKIKSACKYGPIPHCKWTNSSVSLGDYCQAGVSSEMKDVPPVPFCEHPDSKNNQTLCNKLSNEYMMPCKWYENYTSVNGNMQVNCTFNPNAVFGSENTEKEFGVINSEYSCVAAGGTWQTEFYLESNILKQDSWCERGALFDPSTGVAAGNKGNCDMDCWACEFMYNGSSWADSSEAESSCVGSSLGYCRWVVDSAAPNGFGYCDYPKEMDYGAGDCNSNCKDCDLKLNSHEACITSQADCKWVNNSNSSSGSFLSTGYCVAKNKKTCADDCFSCYSESDCFASSINCNWDSSNFLCKPNSFDGEICFDGIDNDQDGMIDCSDPDCSFDNACGGNSFSDCMSITDSSVCGDTVAFGDWNCTWYNFTWEPYGHCGMPGEDCWQYEGNATACGLAYGCTNQSDMSFGKDGFCDVNKTRIDSSQCWNYGQNESICSSQAGCSWVNETWGGSTTGGFCDNKVFAGCFSLNENETACGLNGNCTWRHEDWMEEDEGFCEPACFNHSLDEGSCSSAAAAGICEWRNMSDMCMPEVFDIMGGSKGGGKSGCWQYDGNMTGCNENNYTCIWVNDTDVNNNVSATPGQDISGWCNDKGSHDMMGDMKGAPTFLGKDQYDLGVVDYVDIDGFGMRVTDNAYGFGAGVYNLTDSAICNGLPINMETFAGGSMNTISIPSGTGQNASKFRWYLDTDGSSVNQDHCYAKDSNGASCTSQDTTLCDFEFYIEYIVENDTTTNEIKTRKKLYACVNNDTSGNQWTWVPTNVFVTDDKKFTCFKSGFGSPFVSVEREALESFPLFNITSPMRVFAVSSDMSDLNFDDEVGPAYYTPGTVDFDFVDCSDPNTKDSKCKNFQKFGAQIFEDCKNLNSTGGAIDDDGDGLANCDDPKCFFSPACASGVAFDWDSLCSGDNKAPIISFMKIDKMADTAIINYDTDEPANGSLMFYENSNDCSSLNATVDDVGDSSSYDDYKPFHKAVLDSTTIGYDLVNNTAYYYKIKICDPCGNCGTSKCLNFTTKKENKPFVFRMDLPDGYTVDIDSNGFNYSGNFSTVIGGTTYDVGLKMNTSFSKNMNVTVHYGDLSMKFVGVDLYKPKVLNFGNAFIADSTNEVLGMNSSTKSWNYVLNDMGMGGSGDAIELNFPVGYSSSNTIKWDDDSGSSETDVTDYVTCRDGGSSTTSCKIPVSLGF